MNRDESSESESCSPSYSVSSCESESSETEVCEVPVEEESATPTLYVYEESSASYHAVEEPSPFIEEYYFVDEESGSFTQYTEPIETPTLYAYSEYSESFYEVSEPTKVKGAFYYWDEKSASYNVFTSPVFSGIFGDDADMDEINRRIAAFEASESTPEDLDALKKAEEDRIAQEVNSNFGELVSIGHAEGEKTVYFADFFPAEMPPALAPPAPKISYIYNDETGQFQEVEEEIRLFAFEPSFGDFFPIEHVSPYIEQYYTQNDDGEYVPYDGEVSLPDVY